MSNINMSIIDIFFKDNLFTNLKGLYDNLNNRVHG